MAASNCGRVRLQAAVKAAVVTRFGDVPRYADFDDPPVADDQIQIRVKAAALENFDKMTVAGSHYASKQLFPRFPAIVGHTGVGTLDDGTVVGFGATTPPYGTMAETAIVPIRYRQYLTPLPAGVDASLAAALPASAMTSLLALRYVAKLQSGENVLINGATGVSGKLAVQIARIFGAGRIVGTGRDPAGLAGIQALGADAVIDTSAADEAVTDAFRRHADDGYDVVLDYVWGRPTELLLQALVPEHAGFAHHRTRLVQIGEAAGPAIALRGEAIRTSGVELTGGGNVPPEVVPEAMKQIWQWMADGVLAMDLELVPLRDVARAWTADHAGKRVVIVP